MRRTEVKGLGYTDGDVIVITARNAKIVLSGIEYVPSTRSCQNSAPWLGVHVLPLPHTDYLRWFSHRNDYGHEMWRK